MLDDARAFVERFIEAELEFYQAMFWKLIPQEEFTEEAIEELEYRGFSPNEFPDVKASLHTLKGMCSHQVYLDYESLPGNQLLQRWFKGIQLDDLEVSRQLFMLQEAKGPNGESFFIATVSKLMEYDNHHFAMRWGLRHTPSGWLVTSSYAFKASRFRSDVHNSFEGWEYKAGERFNTYTLVQTQKYRPPQLPEQRASYFRTPMPGLSGIAIFSLKRKVEELFKEAPNVFLFRRICGQIANIPPHPEMRDWLASLAVQLQGWLDEQLVQERFDPDHPAWPLTQVLELDLEKEQLTNGQIDALSSLAYLRKLTLEKASKESVQQVAKLKSLPHLELKYSPDIAEVKVFEGHPSLVELTIERCTNFLSSSEGIPTNVRTLALREQGLDDLSGLTSLDTLRSLRVYQSSHKLKHFAPAPALCNLESLDLSYSDLPSLSGIQTLTRLKSLNLGYGQFDDLTGIEELAQLERLDLWGCKKLKGLAPLSALRNLTYLNLSASTPIVDLEPITACGNIRWLALAGQKLESLEPLRALSKLETIAITYCSILKDTEVLSELSQLRRVILSNCENLSNIDSLEQLPKLEHLFVEDCPKVKSIRKGSRYD